MAVFTDLDTFLFLGSFPDLVYKVFRTQEFERLMKKFLSGSEQERLEDIEDEISEKGFTGDPLGLRFLREKRISGKRIYFLVYEEFKAVLMVSISDKKTQQETIDKIKVFLPEFKKLMEEFIAT